jgi:hypothetical protein
VDSSSTQHIQLTVRLTLSGMLADGGRALDHALVTLTKATGEFVMSTFSDGSGRYEVPLPTAGRYILTGLDPEGLRSESVQVLLASRPAVVDLDLGGRPEPAAKADARVGA